MLASGRERGVAVQLEVVDQTVEYAEPMLADQPAIHMIRTTPGAMSRTDHLLKISIILGSCAIVIAGLITLIV